MLTCSNKHYICDFRDLMNLFQELGCNLGCTHLTNHELDDLQEYSIETYTHGEEQRLQA